MQALACVTRYGRVESIHAGYLCLASSDGRVLAAIGQPCARQFWRSAAKPLQALALVVTGAADRWQLSDAELAIICGSHSGEDCHRSLVSSLLQKGGFCPADLECGAAEPYNATALHALWRRGGQADALGNCCSGKHAGMLLLGRHLSVDPRGYCHPAHPVQVMIRQTIGQALGLPPDEIFSGFDDCGTPALLLSLSQAAAAYARLASGSFADPAMAGAARRISRAMMAQPRMVNGNGEFCTELMQQGAGQVVGKVGGEGAYLVGLPERQLGLAVKVGDGNERAVYPVVVAALRALGVFSPEQLAPLAKWLHWPVWDHHGRQRGAVQPLLTSGFALHTVHLGEELPAELN